MKITTSSEMLRYTLNRKWFKSEDEMT